MGRLNSYRVSAHEFFRHSNKPSLEEYFMHLVEADRAQGAAVEVSDR